MVKQSDFGVLRWFNHCIDNYNGFYGGTGKPPLRPPECLWYQESWMTLVWTRYNTNRMEYGDGFKYRMRLTPAGTMDGISNERNNDKELWLDFIDGVHYV